MYISSCYKLTSVCAIVMSDTMVTCRATSLWNNSTICHHNSSTMTGSIHDYYPPSGYSIRGTENCSVLTDMYMIFTVWQYWVLLISPKLCNILSLVKNIYVYIFLLISDPPPPLSALSDDLRSMVNNPLFSDVKFEVEDKTVYGHRAILAARSEYFMAMFSDGLKESKAELLQVWK